MKGYEVLARALCTSADHCYAVPGYPVTELAGETRAEMVGAEKVALEYALGDSISGKRAAVIVKNVGLNACADPIVQATTQGLIGGVVIVAGDDPGAEASTSATSGVPVHRSLSIPAFATGNPSKDRTISSLIDEGQPLILVPVRVRVTPASSPGPGV